LVGASQARKNEKEKQALLLFIAGRGNHMAIPLSMVARLEEIPLAAVEYSAGQPVIRYRGQILPLVRVSKYLHASEERPADGSDAMQVVVYTHKNGSVGLVVDEIEDIVNEVIMVKRIACGNGIFGSVVIQDRVTDLLDVHAILGAADPSFNAVQPPSTAA
jgi:two-component system chemotaxis sensor kinase CheA